MKKNWVGAGLLAAMLAPAVTCSAQVTERMSQQDVFSREAIQAVMRRACDYQLRIQAEDRATSKADVNYEWVRGAFYTGMLPMYEATGDEKYLKAAGNYGESRHWELDKPDTRHADWQCIGQTYIELFMREREPRMIAGIKRNIDAQMATPQPGRVDWWWCDALYMAPPVLTRLYAVTSDTAYLKYLNDMFWDTHEFLYDKNEHLFYRDKSFFDARSKNGKKVFWSRGNGWVLAGIARLLQYMPADAPERGKYESLFREMAEKIADLQQKDGLWRPSLLDPDDVTTSETSGSAFFTFAMAWGINNGLLAQDKYEEVVKKGWAGLVGAVTPEGKLGYVQKVAAAPGPVNPDDTREYAVGAFLQAGNELLKLQARTKQ